MAVKSMPVKQKPGYNARIGNPRADRHSTGQYSYWSVTSSAGEWHCRLPIQAFTPAKSQERHTDSWLPEHLARIWETQEYTVEYTVYSGGKENYVVICSVFPLVWAYI